MVEEAPRARLILPSTTLSVTLGPRHVRIEPDGRLIEEREGHEAVVFARLDVDGRLTTPSGALRFTLDEDGVIADAAGPRLRIVDGSVHAIDDGELVMRLEGAALGVGDETFPVVGDLGGASEALLFVASVVGWVAAP